LFGDNVMLNNNHLQKNSENKLESTNIVSITFSLLFIIFTIYLLYMRAIHSNDPECLVCGLSILVNPLILFIFLIILIISIVHFVIKKK